MQVIYADIVDAGHGERNVASVREPRVRLQLQLLSVHAGRLRMSYGSAVQVEHTERLEACKLRGDESDDCGKHEKKVGIGKEKNAP
jgi:hypothetical protein